MNDNDIDSNPGPLQPRDFGNFNHRPGSHPNVNGNGKFSAASASGQASRHGLDFWAVADILAQRWHWLVISGVIGAGIFFLLGWNFIQPRFIATAQLLRYETPGISDFLKTPPLSSETFAGLLTSPDLLGRVGGNVSPPIPPDTLVKQVKVDSDDSSDIVKVYFAATTPQEAVNLANSFSTQAVTFTKEMQAMQAAAVAKTYLKEQIADMDKDIGALRNQFRAMPASAEVTNKLAQVGGRLHALNETLASSPHSSMLIAEQTKQLNTAITELNQLTLTYTDQHPAVQQKKAQIQELQKEISEESKNNPGGEISITSTGQILQPDIEVVRARLRSLEDARVEMTSRQREAQMLASNPPGIIRVLAPADLKTTKSGHRRIKIGLISIFGGGFGASFGLLLLVVAEATDKRLRTVHDVQRVTRMPVLTTLGDLQQMPEADRRQWAFRTWTLLQGRLSRSQNHGLVCGVTSSTEREGRSTWINMLAEAASLAGFRVLTIATKPSPTHIECPDASETPNNGAEMKTDEKTDEKRFALASSILSSPGQVTDQLAGPEPRPVVHIPLPGWVWNLERRKQWRDALNHWRKIENLVILVELPPASVPEAVLLGSNLPNLVWLADSGTAQAGETRAQLETLRHARCNLVGAVLNREPAKSLRSRFPRWLGCLALFAALSVCAQAQDAHSNSPPGKIEFTAEPAATNSAEQETDSTISAAAPENANPANLSFSVVRPELAPWQKHLTLGPGDILDFGLYGEPNLTRRNVAIGPDGRVSYLEASDVQAGGLTVDELRRKFDDALGTYRRSPRTIIVPVAYRSKKYFVLGQVVQRGVFILDRPITVIEALARAHGIINGQIEADTVDLADLQRSFLMRNGQRVPVDFEKLFAGDLSQNVALQPGDYLCFPSANAQRVYVLGEVALPGPVVYRPDMTAVGVVTARGGFTEKAFKSKVVVLRGSLNHPQTFVVNVWDVVHGRQRDFQLQPKDIVYVSWRPFSYGEDVVDLAITAFSQAIVTGWVGEDLVQP